MFAHPLAPEDLALVVDQNDADIGPLAVFIKHGVGQDSWVLGENLRIDPDYKSHLT